MFRPIVTHQYGQKLPKISSKFNEFAIPNLDRSEEEASESLLHSSLAIEDSDSDDDDDAHDLLWRSVICKHYQSK